ncbi:DNA-primase RepB domain-containing protein [Sphingobium sp. TomTYG75]
MPSRCAWCDIDDADPDVYDPQPNILWETSPDRFQGIWLWRDVSPGDIAEQVSRNIWAKDGGDKGGWSVTKMLRLPGTINHKPQYRKPIVTLQVYDPRPQKLPRSILSIPTGTPTKGEENVEITGVDPYKIMRRYRRKMGLRAGALMTATRVMRPDRSGAVYLIVVGMIEAGAEDSEIAAVLLMNPYFNSKWGTDLVKAEDQILRIRARLEAGQ